MIRKTYIIWIYHFKKIYFPVTVPSPQACTYNTYMQRQQWHKFAVSKVSTGFNSLSTIAFDDLCHHFNIYYIYRHFHLITISVKFQKVLYCVCFYVKTSKTCKIVKKFIVEFMLARLNKKNLFAYFFVCVFGLFHIYLSIFCKY